MSRQLAPRLAAGVGALLSVPQGPRREAWAILGTAAPVAAMALVNMAMSVTDTLMAAVLGRRADA